MLLNIVKLWFGPKMQALLAKDLTKLSGCNLTKLLVKSYSTNFHSGIDIV